MQALYVENGRVHYRTDHPAPSVAEDQSLIRVSLAGICSTDLEIVKGYAGFEGVLGHEFVGVVEEGPDEFRGRRVVGTINLGCRTCSICLGQGPEHCPHRTVLGIIGHDGAFADYLALPVANLLPVPDEVPDHSAVFVEPLAAAIRIREQVMVSPSDRTAVIGPGRLGMLAGLVLALGGTQVVMLGRREESLELPRRMRLEARLAADCKDSSFDLVVEATGNRGGLGEALRLVKPLGTLVMKSTYAEPADVDLTKLVVGELSVIGSRCGPFAPSLRMLARGEIDTAPLVEAEYALGNGLEALDHAARPGVRKILLRP
ncbi:MAG TPA: alcohol dehydrogenase catalytic domain-containing protein [Anaerolineae bacterium]|nr:alcohol dehydrogenase catalytic domain-containing protein [Anaerolineae bacterium]